MGMDKSGRRDKTGKLMTSAVPGLLVGNPGIGKTDVLKHIAEQVEKALKKPFPIETYATPQLNAEDLSGLPVPNLVEKVTDLYPLRIGKKLREAGMGVAFMDEISSAPPPVGAAALTFIQNGLLGETKLPDSVCRMAAMNPAEVAAAGRELTAPESNRFCWIEWELAMPDWIDFMRGGEGAAGNVVILPQNWERNYWDTASNYVTMYIRRHESALMDMPDADDASKAWASPRSWYNATRLIAACLSVGESMLTELTIEAVKGCIGGGAQQAFTNWVVEMDLPDPEEILSNPKGVELPKRDDKLGLVLESLALAAVREHPNRKQRVQVCYKILESLFESKNDIAMPPIQHLVRNIDDRSERPAINHSAIREALVKMGIDRLA